MINKIYYNGSEFAPLIPTSAQNQALNSGITADKVIKYDAASASVEGKQDKLNRTIKLRGAIEGIVTDTGSNLEINTTSQGTIGLSEVLATDNASSTALSITDGSESTTITTEGIEISKDSVPAFKMDQTTVTGSEDMKVAFQQWLELIKTNNNITDIQYYANEEEAKAAPANTLAFYPEESA